MFIKISKIIIYPLILQSTSEDFPPEDVSQSSTEDISQSSPNDIGAEVLIENENSTKKEDDVWKVQLDIISQGVHDLEKQINGFQAQKDSKEYKHLDEMLTRHLVALDIIDSNGNQEIRQQRKAVIELVNGCIKSLELKAIENFVSNSPSTNTKLFDRKSSRRVE